LKKGDALFVTAGNEISVKGATGVNLFRVTVPRV
jgi:hypothetical protein